MRETIKKVTRTVEGEEMTFQIRKMNALSGSVLLKFVAEKLLPLFSGLQDLFAGEVKENATPEEVEEIAKKRTESVMTIIPQALASISEEELIAFEERCLNTVDVLMPAGWQPVMSGKNFGIEEIENDPIAVLLLCYDVMEFNLGGFFGGKGLSSLLPLKNISQQNA